VNFKPKTKRNTPTQLWKIALFFIILLPATVQSQSYTISLSEAINQGLSNRQYINAGRISRNISTLQTQALYRKYWPQVSVEYNYLYNPILQTSILPIGIFNPTYPIDATKNVQFGTTWTQSAGLTVVQPLLDLSIPHLINEAKLQERITTLTQTQSENELAYAIAQTYIDIYLGEAQVQTLAADTSRSYMSYQLQQSRFDEKRLLKSELNKSKINHNNAIQALTDGIALLIEDKVYLLFLMGCTDWEAWDFDIDPGFAMQYPMASALEQRQVELIPEVQLLGLRSELSLLQIQSAKTKYLPTISFKGFIGANQFVQTFNPFASNTWFGLSYLGLVVKIPILNGENTRNKIQLLQAQSNQFLLQGADKVTQNTKDMFTAKLKMDHLATQLKTQSENIALSGESIDIFLARFEEGQETATNLNLEEINIQLLRLAYEANIKQWWVYWLDYLKASGQLNILWN
jgi:outer membrane protein TolC